jgi:hypothetical protein
MIRATSAPRRTPAGVSPNQNPLSFSTVIGSSRVVNVVGEGVLDMAAA